MKKQIFKHHVDAGHGWLACKLSLLEQLGIAGNISSFSYIRGGTVYLEEDCDASKLVESLENLSIPYEIVNARKPGQRWPDRSPIRGYACYRPGAPTTLKVGQRIRIYGAEYTVTGLHRKGYELNGCCVLTKARVPNATVIG